MEFGPHTTSNAEDYYYQVGVTNDGTGELYVRYNAEQNELILMTHQTSGIFRTDFQDRLALSLVRQQFLLVPTLTVMAFSYCQSHL